MSRPIKILLVAVAALAFIAASLGLARVMSARGAERTLIEQVINDEAAGSASSIAARLDRCTAGTACSDRVAKMVESVASRGAKVKILQVDGAVPLGAGSADGVSRLAWKAGSGLPVVQCAVIRREGSVASGFEVKLLALSKPIAREGTCPELARLLAVPD